MLPVLHDRQVTVKPFYKHSDDRVCDQFLVFCIQNVHRLFPSINRMVPNIGQDTSMKVSDRTVSESSVLFVVVSPSRLPAASYCLLRYKETAFQGFIHKNQHAKPCADTCGPDCCSVTACMCIRQNRLQLLQLRYNLPRHKPVGFIFSFPVSRQIQAQHLPSAGTHDTAE